MTHFFYRFLATSSLLLIAFVAQAQSLCTYQLELTDAFGDGWQGASLRLVINRDTVSYTLDGINDNGSSRTIDIVVNAGDTLILGYLIGENERENTYRLRNNQGDLLFAAGPFPPVQDTVYQRIVDCPSCAGPLLDSIAITRLRSDYIDVDWSPALANAANRYELTIGAVGAAPGTGRTLAANDTLLRVGDLDENTAYDFYLRGICASGDTTPWQGPFSLMTPFANDVGVVDIISPVTGCDPQAPQLTSILQNFGGRPQSFIPYAYAVNGQRISISMPSDGVYTGVLGVDSTDEATIDQPFFFPVLGANEITAWTELEDDSVRGNDTFRITVYNLPTFATLPYREDFELEDGFWYVGEGSTNASWAYGRPEGATIRRAGSGSRAWVTNLTGRYNAGEYSYLASPCFNLMDEANDPVFSFLRFVDTERCCDAAWVEMQLDGGDWIKLGTAQSGTNWYNVAADNWWSGDGGQPGWVRSAHPLTGAAGARTVRLRFVFRADLASAREGFGVDDIQLQLRYNNDLAATQLLTPGNLSCNADNRPQLVVANLGNSAASGFTVSYQLNDASVVTEMVNQSLAAGAQLAYTFTQGFEAVTVAPTVLRVWVTLNGDQQMTNDTLIVQLGTVRSLPYREDFSAGSVPADWTADSDLIVTDQHGLPSLALSDNLFANDNSFIARSPLIGPVQATDSLFFSYRFVDFVGDGSQPTQLQPGDSLEVRLYTNCATDFDIIYGLGASAQVPTTQFTQVGVSLAAYADSLVQVEFVVRRAAGDFYFDLDDIIVRSCPASLGVSAQITDATGFNRPDGRIELSAPTAEGPYTYQWNPADSLANATLSDLLPGEYAVTVTDRFGCSETLLLVVNFPVSTADPLSGIVRASVAPNPTRATVQLDLQLREALPVTLTILNLMGQPLQQLQWSPTTQLREELDLSRYAAGIYLLRVAVPGAAQMLRIVKQ